MNNTDILNAISKILEGNNVDNVVTVLLEWTPKIKKGLKVAGTLGAGGALGFALGKGHTARKYQRLASTASHAKHNAKELRKDTEGLKGTDDYEHHVAFNKKAGVRAKELSKKAKAYKDKQLSKFKPRKYDWAV